MIVVDTSVAVPAALPWHAAHDVAASALPRANATLIAHVGVETYSVLTRLPPPQRVPGAVAGHFLRDAFAFPPTTLSPAGYERLLEVVVAEGISGGAVYDALVAATAVEAEATLLTRDRRAVQTYQRLRADYRLIE